MLDGEKIILMMDMVKVSFSLYPLSVIFHQTNQLYLKMRILDVNWDLSLQLRRQHLLEQEDVLLLTTN